MPPGYNINTHSSSLPPPPHPPPPSASSSSGHGTGLGSPFGDAGEQQQQQQQQQRLRPLQPPLLTTALNVLQQQHQTPHSAISTIASPFASRTPNIAAPRGVSPMASRGAAATPVQAYNPQEWGRNGPVGGSYMPHHVQSGPGRTPSTRAATGYEAALPSPPPPYTESPTVSAAQTPNLPHPLSLSTTYQAPRTTTPTPSNSQLERSNTPSSSTPTSHPSRALSSFQRHAPSSNAVSSPTPSEAPTSFPPPPNQRDRSTSRSRFGLSALTSRNRPATSGSAMDVLQQQTNEVLARMASPPQSSTPVILDSVPPSARRAVSAGCVSANGDHSRRSPDNNSAAVNPYVQAASSALPPPPPGPPPSNSRSQSLGRVPDSTTTPSQPRTRNNLQASQLGPIPPTPANWVDEEFQRQSETHPDVPSLPQAYDTHVPPPPAAGPSYPVASRGTTPIGIRERRSESRASKYRSSSREPTADSQNSSGHLAAVEQDEAKPANLILSSSNGTLGRRRHVSKSKTSPVFNTSKSPQSASTSASPRVWESNDLDRSASLSGKANALYNATPPFSAESDRHKSYTRTSNQAIPRTPGFPPTPAEPFQVPNSAKSSISDRPASRLQHSVNASELSLPVEPSEFVRECSERHRLFTQREAAASSDRERLELFAEYMVHESRIRRDRYPEAFESMGSEVLELTRDMWRTFGKSKRVARAPLSAPLPSNRTTPPPINTSTENQTSREPSSAGSVSQNQVYTPLTEPESPSASSGQNKSRADLARQNSYQPCLSPIPSMAMSTVPDETDSRGRPPSRWWEASTTTSSVGGARKVQRTKRESKYMGLPREARENLQWDPTDPYASLAGNIAESSNEYYYSLGPNEYPADKPDTGGYDRMTPQFPTTPSAPNTPMKPKLDVSRLITLPPPYPRHHPALNNCHPDLTPLRASLRSITDQSDGTRVREAHAELQTTSLSQQDLESGIAERKRELRGRIQAKVSTGEMSFADAAKAEADFEKEETVRSRAAAQKDFDTFQSQVMTPLNAQYSEKVNKATTIIEQLRSSLAEYARSHDPNQAQEEGDEQPELLERLTLMKWFFEARELLHRQMFELEGESDDRYKQVILAPYRLAGNQDKIREVESFFMKDARDRKEKFEQKALKRFEEFERTVEKNVTRGAELQLSAFWDIAPPLLAIVQKVPTNLEGVDVWIPQDEYAENPLYEQFSLQYLYTLLLHANRSAYQFIESQINLLCLLHEVRTGVMAARCKLLDTQRCLAGEDPASVREEMEAVRTDEDARLTGDLKERVELVEEQWRQALGKGMRECMDRVERYLDQQGGWDESLKE